MLTFHHMKNHYLYVFLIYVALAILCCLGYFFDERAFLISLLATAGLIFMAVMEKLFSLFPVRTLSDTEKNSLSNFMLVFSVIALLTAFVAYFLNAEVNFIAVMFSSAIYCLQYRLSHTPPNA